LGENQGGKKMNRRFTPRLAYIYGDISPLLISISEKVFSVMYTVRLKEERVDGQRATVKQDHM
jgi:hypothetical protein